MTTDIDKARVDCERHLRFNVEIVAEELAAVERPSDWYGEHAGESATEIAEGIAEDFAGELEESDRESLQTLLADLNTLFELDGDPEAWARIVDAAAEDARAASEGVTDEPARAALEVLANLLERPMQYLEDHSGPVGAWLNDQLEIYADGRYSLASPGWTAQSFGVLCPFGGPFGGPTVRVAFTSSGFEVSGYWGGDEAHVFGACEPVAEYLGEIFDPYEAEGWPSR